MVPLDGDEDIGEASRGYLGRQLSRLEECKTRGPKAVINGSVPAIRQLPLEPALADGILATVWRANFGFITPGLCGTFIVYCAFDCRTSPYRPAIFTAVDC